MGVAVISYHTGVQDLLSNRTTIHLVMGGKHDKNKDPILRNKQG